MRRGGHVKDEDKATIENPAAAWEIEAARSYESMGLFDATPAPLTLDWDMELAFRRNKPQKSASRKPTAG
jgi:hypothetical protein